MQGATVSRAFCRLDELVSWSRQRCSRLPIPDRPASVISCKTWPRLRPGPGVAITEPTLHRRPVFAPSSPQLLDHLSSGLTVPARLALSSGGGGGCVRWSGVVPDGTPPMLGDVIDRKRRLNRRGELKSKVMVTARWIRGSRVKSIIILSSWHFIIK
jgi:hypothetical protein